MTGPKRTTVQKCSWSAEEDRILTRLVGIHGPKRWSLIAHSLEGRIGKQCRERWHNHLNPAVRKDAWTVEEDTIIYELVEKIGTKWATIAKHLEGRTDNSIKNRYYSSLKRQYEQRKNPRADRPADDDEDDCDRSGHDDATPALQPIPVQPNLASLASPLLGEVVAPLAATACSLPPSPPVRPKAKADRKRRRSAVATPDSPPSKRERRASCVSVSSVAESLPGDVPSSGDEDAERRVVSSPKRRAHRGKPACDGPVGVVFLNDLGQAFQLPPPDNAERAISMEGGYTLHVRVLGPHPPSPPPPASHVDAPPQQPAPVPIVLAQDQQLRIQHNLLWAHESQSHCQPFSVPLQHQPQEGRLDLDDFPSVPLPPLSLEMQYNSMLEV